MGGIRLREVVAHGGLTVAYEINVQGWKKRLGLEGVAGGAAEAVLFKSCYCQAGGGGTIVMCHFFWGGWGVGGGVNS